MSQLTKSHTVKVTGISEEMLRLLDGRVQERRGTGRAGYIRELIRRDIMGDKRLTFREILAPIHEHTSQQGYTEEELDTLFQAGREKVPAQRRRERAKSSPSR